MTPARKIRFEDINARLDGLIAAPDTALLAAAPELADELVALGETILETWLAAHDTAPTASTVEGFRLLALQRQGARGDASFNACRETCRELVYHRNLVCVEQAEPIDRCAIPPIRSRPATAASRSR